MTGHGRGPPIAADRRWSRPVAGAAGMMAGMPGVVIIVVVLVVVFPIAVIMSGGIAAAILGWFLKEDVDATGDEVWRELNY